MFQNTIYKEMGLLRWLRHPVSNRAPKRAIFRAREYKRTRIENGGIGLRVVPPPEMVLKGLSSLRRLRLFTLPKGFFKLSEEFVLFFPIGTETLVKIVPKAIKELYPDRFSPA